MWANRRPDIQKIILWSFFWILNVDAKMSNGYFLSSSLLSKMGLSSVIYLYNCSLNLLRFSSVFFSSLLEVSVVGLFDFSDSVTGLLFAWLLGVPEGDGGPEVELFWGSEEVSCSDTGFSYLLWEDMVLTSIRQAGSLKPQVNVRELRGRQAEMPPWVERRSLHTGPLYIRGMNLWCLTAMSHGGRL